LRCNWWRRSCTRPPRGFVNRAERTGEALLAWVAAALVLAALSRLNYFLFPSLYSEFVYTGDFFRIAFYLALLAGVSREIASYQRRLAETAIFQERRRLARDLHDGLAQELAYIAVQSRQLRNGSDRERVIARITGGRRPGRGRVAPRPVGAVAPPRRVVPRDAVTDRRRRGGAWRRPPTACDRAR
jgi:hypothetical protein